MPVAVAVIVGAVISASVAYALAIVTFYGALVLFTSQVLLSALMQAMAPDLPGVPSGAGVANMVRQPVVSRRIIYGQRRVSGPLVFMEATGIDNKFLHFVIVLGTAGPYEEIGEVWLDDDIILNSDLDADGFVNTGSPTVSEAAQKYGDKIRIKKHLGAHNQAADADLVSETSAKSTLTLGGCAYIYVRLEYDQDVFINVPNLSAVVKGRKVYDPRENLLTFSEQLDHPDWVDVGTGVITANQIIAPDGTLTADKMEDTDGAGRYEKIQAITVADDSESHTLAVRAFAGTQDVIRLRLRYTDGSTVDAEVYFDLTNETTLFSPTVDSWTITALPQTGWYLLTATKANNGTGNATLQGRLAIGATTADTGDLYPWGMQLQKATEIGGYAKTEATAIAAQDADDPNTWEHTSNAALIMLDYLRGVPAKVASGAVERIHGIAAPDENIEMALAVEAAEVCDEQVETGTGSPSEYEDRYASNAVIDTIGRPADILNAMRMAMAGEMIYADGVWRILAGEYRAHTVTLDADDFRGPLKVTTRIGRRELFNAIKGTFVSPDNNWQPTDYPVITSSAYEAEDNGVRIWRPTYNLPITTSSAAAQRLAKIVLQRVRRQITVQMPCKLTAFRVRAGDTVAVTYDRFGWDDKTFEVVGWKLASELADDGAAYIGVDLNLREFDSTVYDWDVGEEQPPIAPPETNLPDPFDVAAPTGLALDSGSDQLYVSADGTVTTRIKAVWTAAADGFVTNYEVQFKLSDDTEWTSRILDASVTEYFISPAEDGRDFDFRVRSVTGAGTRSAFDTVSGHLVLGKSELPPDLGSFTVTRLADGTRKFAWNLASVPADVRAGGGYKIRYLSGSETDWSVMTALHDGLLISSPYETNELSAGDYSFAIKAVDSSDNESANALFIELTLGDPRLENVLLSRQEHELGFPGQKTDCFVDDDGVLKSTSSGGWDDIPEGSPSEWNSLPDSWDQIHTQNSPITYETPEIDLGAVTTFTPLITTNGDGTAVTTMRTGGDGSPQIETAYGSVTTVTARYVQFKTEVTGSAPTIREQTILLDGETKVVDREDVDTSSETGEWFESLAAGHFRVRGEEQASITTAQITAIQNVGGGWTWELISKNANLGSPDEGPAAEFKVYNASSVLADATVDVTLKGPKS